MGCRALRWTTTVGPLVANICAGSWALTWQRPVSCSARRSADAEWAADDLRRTLPSGWGQVRTTACYGFNQRTANIL
jgi:hypothetical protein